ncbi:unnamed protein product [Fraxinus pennsylvanica]|uniref:Uncharacterized protein n=1 Tax=Fraxinus pennsylvanica TaxID=56036 RepID=A0AAD1ZZV5_9LAMI|nr:unnamed protein product [Fraxinus pennsylvanica]
MQKTKRKWEKTTNFTFCSGLCDSGNWTRCKGKLFKYCSSPLSQKPSFRTHSSSHSTFNMMPTTYMISIFLLFSIIISSFCVLEGLDHLKMLSNCTGAPFHDITDQNLISRLESSWPDLRERDYKGARDQKFWKHEWVEHGTCSTTPNDYKAYFNLAVDLKNKHDILQTLGQSGIRPAGQLRTVNISEVHSSIVRATRRQIQIRCKIINQNKKKPHVMMSPLLYEIIICYDPRGTKWHRPCAIPSYDLKDIAVFVEIAKS